MSRRDKKRTTLTGTILTWTLTLALMAWGAWQLASFHKTILADAQKLQEQSSETPTPPPETIVDIDPVEPTAMPNDRELALMRSVDTDTSAPAPTTLDTPATEPADRTAQIADFRQRADSLLAEGRIVEGRAALNNALACMTAGDSQSATLRRQLASLNVPVFLGSDILPEDPLSLYAEIRPGDSFLKIGHTYFIPSALIAKLNPNLSPTNLKPGTGVKVVTGPFHLRVSKGLQRIDLYLRDMYVRSYDITMEEGNFLPRGLYRIKKEAKIQVGTRLWIGFESATDNLDSVEVAWFYGSAGPRGRSTAHGDTSRGIKLADADLAQLYNVLVESHSTVRIEP